jgi:hypothetical protein
MQVERDVIQNNSNPLLGSMLLNIKRLFLLLMLTVKLVLYVKENVRFKDKRQIHHIIYQKLSTSKFNPQTEYGRILINHFRLYNI